MNMRNAVIITLAILTAAVITLSSAIYYMNTKVNAAVTQQPIIMKNVNETYIEDFQANPTGIYVEIKVSESQVMSTGNYEIINVVLAQMELREHGELTFQVNPQYIVLINIEYSNGTVIGTYPQNNTITLNPGKYLITEELILPGNTTGNIEINGEYTFKSSSVALTYSLSELIIIEK